METPHIKHAARAPPHPTHAIELPGCYECSGVPAGLYVQCWGELKGRYLCGLRRYRLTSPYTFDNTTAQRPPQPNNMCRANSFHDGITRQLDGDFTQEVAAAPGVAVNAAVAAVVAPAEGTPAAGQGLVGPVAQGGTPSKARAATPKSSKCRPKKRCAKLGMSKKRRRGSPAVANAATPTKGSNGGRNRGACDACRAGKGKCSNARLMEGHPDYLKPCTKRVLMSVYLCTKEGGLPFCPAGSQRYAHVHLHSCYNKRKECTFKHVDEGNVRAEGSVGEDGETVQTVESGETLDVGYWEEGLELDVDVGVDWDALMQTLAGDTDIELSDAEQME